MRDLNEVLASVLGWVLIAIITCIAIPLERYVNQLTNRILDRKKASAQPTAVSYQPKLEA